MKELINSIDKIKDELQETLAFDEVYLAKEIIEKLATNEPNSVQMDDNDSSEVFLIGDHTSIDGIFCCPDFWEDVIEKKYNNIWYTKEPKENYLPTIVLSQGGSIDTQEPYWYKIFIYTYEGKLRVTLWSSDSHGAEYLTKVL